jgi:hypothetical protein
VFRTPWAPCHFIPTPEISWLQLPPTAQVAQRKWDYANPNSVLSTSGQGIPSLVTLRGNSQIIPTQIRSGWRKVILSPLVLEKKGKLLILATA